MPGTPFKLTGPGDVGPTFSHSEGTTIFAGVSFARTPVDEISAKDAELRAAGWEPTGSRGDPWALTYEKTGDPPPDEAELIAIMGDYWVDEDRIRELLKK